jgi:NAD/NADP transhydrogenase beta subunit
VILEICILESIGIWAKHERRRKMGITLIEQIGIVTGIVIGVSGFIYSVMQSRRQRK